MPQKEAQIIKILQSELESTKRTQLAQNSENQLKKDLLKQKLLQQITSEQEASHKVLLLQNQLEIAQETIQQQ